MKRSEQSLLVIFYLIFIVFFAYLFLIPSAEFSDSETKKLGILFVFIMGMIAFGTFTGSVTKGFALLFPLFFQLNKTIFEIEDYLTLPPVLDEKIKMISIVIFIAFLVLLDFKNLARALSFKPVLFYNLFVFTGLLTLVWAMNINAALAYIPKIILLPIAYYVFTRLFELDERNVLYTSWGLIIAGGMSVIFIWPDYFGIKWFSFLLSDAGTGGYQDPDSVRAAGLVSRAAISLVLATTIPYIYNFAIYYYPRYKLWAHAAGIFLLLTLFLTLSRMDVLATSFGVGLVLLYMLREREIKVNIALIIFGLLFFGVAAYYIVSANGNSVEEALTRDTWEGRLRQFSAGFANFFYSYGFGVGMNNYLVSYVSTDVLGSNSWNFRTGNTLHSDYIRILGEYGLGGFIFFVSFYISAFRTKIKAPEVIPLVRGAKITVGVLAVCGLSEPSMNLDASIIVCGIYLAIIGYYKNKDRSAVFTS